MSFMLEIEMEQLVCSCGVLYAIPKRLNAQKRKDGTAFFCPQGHAQSYEDSGARKAREAFDAEKAKTAAAQAELALCRMELKKAEGALKPLREHLKAMGQEAAIHGFAKDTSRHKVYNYLKENPGKTVREVRQAAYEKKINVNETSVSGTLSALHSDGVVTRTGSPFRYRVVPQAQRPPVQ
jgi:hypothetical protein